MGGMGQQNFNGVNQYGMMQQQQTRVSNGQGNFGPVMNNGMMGPVMNNMGATGNNPGVGGGNMMMNNGAGPIHAAGFQQNGMTKMASMQQQVNKAQTTQSNDFWSNFFIFIDQSIRIVYPKGSLWIGTGRDEQSHVSWTTRSLS